MELRDTGSQCTVTWLLSMSDTLRFKGAAKGPGENGSLTADRADKSEAATTSGFTYGLLQKNQ